MLHVVRVRPLIVNLVRVNFVVQFVMIVDAKQVVTVLQLLDLDLAHHQEAAMALAPALTMMIASMSVKDVMGSVRLKPLGEKDAEQDGLRDHAFLKALEEAAVASLLYAKLAELLAEGVLANTPHA